MSCACRNAAPAAPSSGISRVFAAPGRGALAKTMTRVASLVRGIAEREPVGIGAEAVCEAQAPHEQHRAQHAVRFPPAPRCSHAMPETQRSAGTPKRRAERDVLHQRDARVTAGALERL